MKNVYFLLFLILLSSCNSFSNISKEDICGKEFTQTIDDPMYKGMATHYTTIFNCDGSFESSSSRDLETPSPSHPWNGEKLHFKGKWSLVSEIPENVKQAVIKYGKEDSDYSIIKYSSTNGVNGYCIFYNDSIEPLNTGQVSDYDWGNVSGASGIFGGFKSANATTAKSQDDSVIKVEQQSEPVIHVENTQSEQQQVPSVKYDKATTEREIKEIKKRFYSINYSKLRADSIKTSEHFPSDLTIVYTDHKGDIVKITTIMQGASIRSDTDYYYYDRTKLYFIYSYANPTNTTPKFEKRTYVYNNDVIKIIENSKEVDCMEDCDFSLQSEPYRLMRFYYGHNY